MQQKPEANVACNMWTRLLQLTPIHFEGNPLVSFYIPSDKRAAENSAVRSMRLNNRGIPRFICVLTQASIKEQIFLEMTCCYFNRWGCPHIFSYQGLDFLLALDDVILPRLNIHLQHLSYWDI